jgi:hypothetical protein
VPLPSCCFGFSFPLKSFIRALRFFLALFFASVSVCMIFLCRQKSPARYSASCPRVLRIFPATGSYPRKSSRSAPLLPPVFQSCNPRAPVATCGARWAGLQSCAKSRAGASPAVRAAFQSSTTPDAFSNSIHPPPVFVLGATLFHSPLLAFSSW